MFRIREYEEADETGWVRCRALSFLGSAFFDDVRQEKEVYEHPSIELVADDDESGIVGLLDLEEGIQIGPLDDGFQSGMIWHVAVHPDHQRQGIGAALLDEAERCARERGLARIGAWTRDDAYVRRWYESHGFVFVDGYLHVYLERDEGLRELDGAVGELRLVKAFAHYTGDRPEEIKARYRRVHEDVLYEKQL